MSESRAGVVDLQRAPPGVQECLAPCYLIREACFNSVTEADDLRCGGRGEAVCSLSEPSCSGASPECRGRRDLIAGLFLCRRTLARFVGKTQLLLEGLDGVDCLQGIAAWPEAISE